MLGLWTLGRALSYRSQAEMSRFPKGSVSSTRSAQGRGASRRRRLGEGPLNCQGRYFRAILKDFIDTTAFGPVFNGVRSYRKCYRSEDFKTVTFTPNGLTVSNSGQNAGPGQVAKMFFKEASLFGGKPYTAIQVYNEIAAAAQVEFRDANGLVYFSTSGLSYANQVFDLRFFKDHPEN